MPGLLDLSANQNQQSQSFAAPNTPLTPAFGLLDAQLPVQAGGESGVDQLQRMNESKKKGKGDSKQVLEDLGIDPEILNDPELLGQLLQTMGKFQKRWRAQQGGGMARGAGMAGSSAGSGMATAARGPAMTPTR